MLQSSFKNRNIYKEYVCLVEGKLRTQSGKIEVPLSRSRNNRVKREVSNDGKVSSSSFEVIDESNTCSKLKIELITGRNHQIRSQMEFIGNPIINDGFIFLTIIGLGNGRIMPPDFFEMTDVFVSTSLSSYPSYIFLVPLQLFHPMTNH